MSSASAEVATSAMGSRGIIGEQRADVLMQTWGEALDGGEQKQGDTPVTRVVNLLKDMQSTLKKEMDEDEELYKNLACWCNNNQYEKTQAISEAEARIAELTSSIDELTAKCEQLQADIKQLEADVAANKENLATATAMREKEGKAFHKEEIEAIANIEALKGAIMVISRHHGSALPQLSVSLLAVRSQDRTSRGFPWDSGHESEAERSFDDFQIQNSLFAPGNVASTKFLQPEEPADTRPSSSSGWSIREKLILSKAFKTATDFMQAQGRQADDLIGSYGPHSGEILGIMKQLKEEMEASLSEAQKTEMAAAASFEALRTAKTKEIRAGEQQAETKEDQLAKASMDLAEAKEDIEQTKASLSESEQFMLKLKETCAAGGKDFEKRKSARLAEIKAVSEAIEILTADEARDTFGATYSFIQISRSQRTASQRHRAAALLKRVASRVNSPDLSVMATRVQLDAFSRVKKAIDDMVAMLKQQQEDEVKKHDWCNSELQSNDMATAKAETAKGDLDAKISDLDSSITTFQDEMKSGEAQIAQLQVDLQRASENRLKENHDFQTTVADQRVTVSVLKAALEKLAKFYDSALLQAHSNAHHSGSKAAKKQTQPVQMEYKPNQGANAIMSMIEKLIYEAKDLEKESIKSEKEAQAQYESVISDTNGSISALLREIAAKKQAKAIAGKEKAEDEVDLTGVVKEIEELATYNAELHAECDYLVKNFSTRQQARQEEIEALQQAKQILSGASLG